METEGSHGGGKEMSFPWVLSLRREWVRPLVDPRQDSEDSERGRILVDCGRCRGILEPRL